MEKCREKTKKSEKILKKLSKLGVFTYCAVDDMGVRMISAIP